jgi:multidrug efflux pump subunit AcrB
LTPAGNCQGLIRAAKDRMMLIAAPPLATGLGLVPRALGPGGADVEPLLAIAVIPGPAVQWLLVLTALPALLILLRRRRPSGYDSQLSHAGR